MKKIAIYVWGDYDYDDRIKKKSISLSKNNKVIVTSITPTEKPYKQKCINKNLKVRYFWLEKKKGYEWFLYRLILNKKFWKDKLVKADIYDCNDPDTLNVGVLAKQRYPNSTLIYDSHEFWKNGNKKFNSFCKTLYSYVLYKSLYRMERKCIKYVDKVITVSYRIAKTLIHLYKKPTFYLPNCSLYDSKNNYVKNKKAVYMGASFRPGAEKIITLLLKLGWEVTVIGRTENKIKGVEYVGFLEKDKYMKIMNKCSVGICYFTPNCDSLKYCLPNKLFDYMQSECVVISHEDIYDVSEIVEEFGIGFSVGDNVNKNILKNKLIKCFNNELLTKNLKSTKKQFRWTDKEVEEIYGEN